MPFAITNPVALAEIEKAKQEVEKSYKTSLKRQQARTYYKANREACIEREREGYQIIRSLMLAAKDKPCVDCGVQLPAECMEFDHVRGVKEFTLGNWRTGAATSKRPPGVSRIEVIRSEIAKCDIRCPNCHTLRHYNNKQASSPDDTSYSSRARHN